MGTKIGTREPKRIRSALDLLRPTIVRQLLNHQIKEKFSIPVAHSGHSCLFCHTWFEMRLVHKIYNLKPYSHEHYPVTS